MVLIMKFDIGRFQLIFIIFTVTSCGGGGGGGAIVGSASASTNTTVPSSPAITSISAGSGQAIVSFSAPASNGGADISSYTVSCVSGASTPATSTGVGSPITVSGLINGTSYNCTVRATNSQGAGAPSAVTGITPSSGEVSQIYATPANFSTQVNKSFTPTTPLTATSSVVNRGRYLIADSAVATSSSNYLTVGIPYVDTNSSGYTVILNTLTSASTYNDYLAKTIQLVSSSDGYYRLDSHLHPNEAIDVDSLTSNLKFRNNFGKIAVTGNGYITFSYDSTTHLLQAKNRYVYIFDTTSNASSYALDANFSGKEKYVNAASGVLSLTTVGSPLYLYPTPLDLGIPGFMNPQSVAMVSNAPAPFKTKITYTPTEVISRIFNNVKTTYQPQITSIGTSTTTKLAADLQLSLIKSTLEANGDKLRYEPTLYSAFRDAALATKLISDSVADGSPGQNLVPYVYFTNERDAAGKYHPFMVVVTYANPGSPNGLKDIPRPPGDGSGPYGSSKVTRYANLENYVLMIPMKDYGQVATVTDNVLGRTLWSDVPNTKKSKDVYTYADTADNGLLIDGSVMFPVFNNTLIPSSLVGELSANGCHVGQGGGGPHCHADGYQSGGALNLYNDSDYLGAIHPPLIGFGYDGIALFALYRPTDTSLKGYGTLDEFGGHNHDAIGYHYHAHTVVDYQPEGESTNLRSTLHVLMKGAYIGKIGPVPCFRTNTNFNNNKYMGGTPTSPASCAQ